MTKSLFIIGSGGHAKVILELLRDMNDCCVMGMIEKDENDIDVVKYDINIISQTVFLKRYLPSEVILVNGVGSTDVSIARKKIFLFFKKKGYRFQTIIHPTAYVSRNVMIGEGSQILAGSILQTGSVLGDNTIINTGAVVDHDCQIGHHSHIAPGVTLSGGVFVGECCHIGVAATVVQSIQIQENSLVAAGAVVISNVAANSRVAGVPARLM